MKVDPRTKRGRVLKAIVENYPVTIRDLSRILGMGEVEIGAVLKELANRGIVELEPLPDKVFVRISVPIEFVERSESQRRFIKRRKKRFKGEIEGYV